jgi:hypothetical protein
MIGGVPIINPFGDSDTESESESYTVNGKPLNYPALANIFPPSLETLIINHPGQSVKYFMPLLVEIARACKMEKRLPNLRLVSLEDLVVPQSLKSHQATFDQAEGFLKEVGIDFLPPALAGSDSDTGYRGYSWGGYGGSDDEYWPPSDYSGDSYDFDEDAGFFNFP